MTTKENAMTTFATMPAAPGSTSAGRRGRRHDVGALVFRITALFLAGFVLTGPAGLSYLPAPWRDVGKADPTLIFELHRWHVAALTAFVALFVAGTLLAAAWAPRRSAAPGQAFLLAIWSLSAAALSTPEPAAYLVPTATLTALFLLTYPQRRRLLRGPRWAQRSRGAVAAASLATPFLLFDVARNVLLQRADAASHGELGHWALGAALSAALLIGGWLAAFGGRSGRPLGLAIGVTYLYLAVAALVLPAHDGSWAYTGAAVALVTGLAFSGVARPFRPGLQADSPAVDGGATSPIRPGPARDATATLVSR